MAINDAVWRWSYEFQYIEKLSEFREAFIIPYTFVQTVPFHI